MTQFTRPMKYTTTRTLGMAFLALAPIAVTAQGLKDRVANKYAEQFDYPRVAAMYQSQVDKGTADAADLRRLALAYKRMGQMENAERTYKQLTDSSAAAPDMWEYAEVLRANGKYTEANAWYAKYAAQNPDDQRAQAYVRNPDLFDRLNRDSASATVRAVPINSPQADLGLAIMNELLIFSSARGEGVGGKADYSWDGQPFLNMHSALLKGETATEPMVMRKEVNSRFHDGTASYDSVAHRLYFTRNNWHYGTKQLAEDGELKLGIFFSDVEAGEFGNQEWGALIPFDHNNPDHNVGQPCVTHDGRRIFFVSDMVGGQGGTDIWFCDNLGNNWGVPQNMGPKVNTAGNEMYPFVDRDSTLFFASNGHPGLGGMDLFRTRLLPAGPGTVFNLKAPMNSRFNDHGLVLLRDDSTGFFVSDRPGGLGSDDIYGCTVRPPMMFLAGIVIDKVTREPIEGATILLKDEHNAHVKRFQLETEPGGKFKIDAEYRSKYVIVANKNGYFQKEVSVMTDADPLENIVVEMTKYDYAAEGVVMHGETEQPLAGAKVMLYDGNDQLLEELTTNETGKYAFALKPESDYRLRVEKEGFFKQSARISTKGKPSAIIHTDFRLFPLDVGQVVRLDNIYYDYNKWNIRPDAAIELDKLVQTLNDNPTVKIELSSHTDCRGKDAYNASLSEKRAKSAVDYVISKGIAKARVTSKGYGESVPFAKCVCEKCSDDEHQSNRRTEFKVLSK
ncbi:MAG: carboxypeptidase regulatory-like domain-containing protein [Flavobacteriales bacterium]|nr:carboxypeptidase regulatory-like domain-containing protein [Flavobacteriales bacterium]